MSKKTETTIFQGQQVKVKMTDVEWIGSPRKFARVYLTVRTITNDMWKTMPDAIHEQFAVMADPLSTKSANMPEIEYPNQNVRFRASAVTTKEEFAAMGTVIKNFSLKRQQAKGDSAEEVLLTFAVEIDLDESSAAWMVRAYETELFAEFEQAVDPQQSLDLSGDSTERLEPKAGKGRKDGTEAVQ